MKISLPILCLNRLPKSLWCSATILGGTFLMPVAAEIPSQSLTPPQDEFNWIEDGASPRVKSWVTAQNERTFAALKGDARFNVFFNEALRNEAAENTLESGVMTHPKEFSVFDGWLYQVQQSTEHPRGLWRRMKVDSFVKGTPMWDELLDIDALSRAEGRPYTPQQAWNIYEPKGDRCLLCLQEGASGSKGSLREYDLKTKTFIKDGFNLPPGSRTVLWKDHDTLLLTGNYWPESIDKDKLSLVLKSWKRGQPLAAAEEVLRIKPGQGIGSAFPIRIHENPDWFSISNGTKNSDRQFLHRSASGEFEKIFTVPGFLYAWGMVQGEFIFSLQSHDWTIGGKTWKAGSIISVPIPDSPTATPQVRLIVDAISRTEIGWIWTTVNGLLVTVSTNAQSELRGYTLSQSEWTMHRIPLPKDSAVWPLVISDGLDKTAFVNCASYVRPTSTHAVEADGSMVALGQSPSSFKSDEYLIEYCQACSLDGTLVPYEVVRSKDAPLNGSNPTLLRAYGAFRAPPLQGFDPQLASLWLGRGGTYVYAHIRGGSDLGPDWYVAGGERHKTYEDFFAVTQDLIAKKITSPKRLGIWGMSAGGLLMGVMITHKPELFGAAILDVPMLDLFRYDLSLTGKRSVYLTLGVAEMGDANIPSERAIMEATSPFQNLRKGLDVPTPLILTSATDENVFPAGPRRFAAKAESLGLPFYFFQTDEGGHGMGYTPEEKATVAALNYIYLTQRLVDPK